MWIKAKFKGRRLFLIIDPARRVKVTYNVIFSGTLERRLRNTLKIGTCPTSKSLHFLQYVRAASKSPTSVNYD